MSAQFQPFVTTIRNSQVDLTRQPLQTLQVNIGKICNQACHHCHVESSPKRTENMSFKTVNRLLDLLKSSTGISLVDVTGGAPEMNPNFRYFVSEVRGMGIDLIDRCNLTILFEPGQEDTAEFLAAQKVQVVASLPCYSKDNVEKQRGRGVFGKSIDALKKLNDLGYAKPGTGLKLSLVYNPVGAFLPPEEKQLEKDYKRELKELFDIEFDELFTITNMPIKRFLQDLQKQGKYDEYMNTLANAFNPVAAENVMCRSLVSVGWDGEIYDCDFNQMLEIPISWEKRTLWDIDSFAELTRGAIALKDHCYGCTAGAGSSCGGTLTESTLTEGALVEGNA